MFEFLAPSAFLIPISLVLSMILTSMMFITPTPPTTREMAAITEIAIVITSRTLLIVESSDARSWHVKLKSLLSLYTVELK